MHERAQAGRKALLTAQNALHTLARQLQMQPAAPILPRGDRPHAAKSLCVCPQLLFLRRKNLRAAAHALSHLFENSGHTGILLRNQLSPRLIFLLRLSALKQRVHALIERKHKIRKSQALRRKMPRKVAAADVSGSQKRSGDGIQRAQRRQLVPLPAIFPRRAAAAHPIRRPVKHRAEVIFFFARLAAVCHRLIHL